MEAASGFEGEVRRDWRVCLCVCGWAEDCSLQLYKLVVVHKLTQEELRDRLSLTDWQRCTQKRNVIGWTLKHMLAQWGKDDDRRALPDPLSWLSSGGGSRESRFGGRDVCRIGRCMMC